jgi:hypothetical protein
VDVGPSLKFSIINKILAERVGFEPTLPFRVNTLSKRAPSATRPSLRLDCYDRRQFSVAQCIMAAQPRPRKKHRVSNFSRTSFLILWLMSWNRNLSAGTCAAKVYFAFAPGHSLRVVGCKNSEEFREFQESFSGIDMGSDGASPAPAAAAAAVFAFPFVGSAAASGFLSSPTR